MLVCLEVRRESFYSVPTCVIHSISTSPDMLGLNCVQFAHELNYGHRHNCQEGPST